MSSRRISLAALLALATVCASAPPSRAHGPGLTPPAPSAEAQQAETLTQTLATATASLATASPGERRRLEQTLSTAAATRRQLLLSLMESDPGTVLRLALAGSVLSALPAQARAHVEQHVQLEGTLEIMHEDWPGNVSQNRYGLSTASGRYSLHFADEEPTHLQTGARIRVRGVRLDSMLALAGGSNKDTQTVTAAPALSALGEQRTLVMLVNFEDKPLQPWTREQVHEAIFGTMDAFIRENSYGAAWVTGDVTDWLTIPLSSSVCDTGTLAKQATQAAETAGWRPAEHPRWMFVFAKNACGFAGAALLGGMPSRAWLNGTIELRFAAHEYGHGFGLWHSHSMDCGDVPLGPECTTAEYGDTLDLMGTAQTAHYNSFQKERLGWLTPLLVTDSGTYALHAYEVAGAPLALKILKATDTTTGHRTWFYLEARKPIGFDTTLVYPGMTDGVVIRLGSESTGNTSYMLDMTPNSRANDRLDPGLVTGQTFDYPEAGLTVTTLSVTATDAVVGVQLSTSGTVSADPVLVTSPTVTVATDRPSYARNQQVSVMTMVTSGAAPVAGASVTFRITDPSAGVIMGNATTGTDGTAFYKFRIKKQSPVGTYQVGAEAKTDTLAGTATTTFIVQ